MKPNEFEEELAKKFEKEGLTRAERQVSKCTKFYNAARKGKLADLGMLADGVQNLPTKLEEMQIPLNAIWEEFGEVRAVKNSCRNAC